MGFDTRASSAEEFLKNTPAQLELKGPYSKIPNWKCVDFWMGGSKDGAPSGALRENWRTNSYGPINFAASPVSPNVLLIPDGSLLEMSGGLELEEASAALGKTDILELLQEASAIFAGSMTIPQWKPKVLKGFKGMTIPNSFKFKFHYGAAGLYDAFEEVVKPVYALIGFFGVKGSKFNSATITEGLPYPTKGKFIAEKLFGAVNGVGELIKKEGSDGPAANRLAQINANLQSALASGAAGIAMSSAYMNLWISWGRFTMGPFQFQDIKFNFDMSTFDANGWPCNGEFEVNGIESMRVSSSSALTSSVIQGV